MSNNLKDLILEGKFEEAKIVSKHLSFEELDGELTDIAFTRPSMSIYTFIVSLLIENEKIEFHEIAFEMLVNPLCHIEGAHHAALYHARRCIELADQQELAEYLSYLLFLHEVPDKVINDDEALATAKKILELDSDNDVAKEFLAEK
ncbi:hypothetical protein SAMN05421503_2090 [Terribacillus aidingensis]|uniref:Immunity protein 30 n=1 Tax=Terribacillus aidingensis TaxID=586416 RepID=A0A285NPX2_9BACI|nr:hypothetical protein [Terribacillus aidingensis]SNZ11580.1 hypothetical protein SAMN05421503_2090 [Terribacillus aidingensis]